MGKHLTFVWKFFNRMKLDNVGMVYLNITDPRFVSETTNQFKKVKLPFHLASNTKRDNPLSACMYDDLKLKSCWGWDHDQQRRNYF